MDELIKYTVKKGFYNQVNEVDIYLPNGLRLVYCDGSVGEVCHTGHNHYMGFTRYNENLRKEVSEANRWVNTYRFGDLLLFKIDDILDDNNVLPVYDYKEMMEEFKLNNYFIIYKKPTLYKTKINYETVINDVWSEKVQEEHIYQILRIKELQGPYRGLGFLIMIESDFPPESTEEFYMMKEHKISNLTDLFYETSFRKIKIEVKRDAWKEYLELEQKVISRL